LCIKKSLCLSLLMLCQNHVRSCWSHRKHFFKLETLAKCLTHVVSMSVLNTEAFHWRVVSKLQCWFLLPLPPHRDGISCKRVFQANENPDGTVCRYKAQLAVRELNQHSSFDFRETLSPSYSIFWLYSQALCCKCSGQSLG